jgi:hypothetical protein
VRGACPRQEMPNLEDHKLDERRVEGGVAHLQGALGHLEHSEHASEAQHTEHGEAGHLSPCEQHLQVEGKDSHEVHYVHGC